MRTRSLSSKILLIFKVCLISYISLIQCFLVDFTIDSTFGYKITGYENLFTVINVRTGNINMVPGGPGKPSAPGKPGRPGGP
jgi:hypothetical protein